MGHPLTLVNFMEMYPTLVAATAEQTPGGGLGRAHLRVIDDASAKTLTKAAGATVQPGSTVRTDGWSSCRALPEAGYLHEPRAESTPQAAAELLPSGSYRDLQLQAPAARRLPWRQRRAPAVLPRRVLLAAPAAVTSASTSSVASWTAASSTRHRPPTPS